MRRLSSHNATMTAPVATTEISSTGLDGGNGNGVGEDDEWDENMFLLMKFYSAGIAIFVLFFLATIFATKRYHLNRRRRFSWEVTLIKYNMKLMRTAMILLLVLQAPLLMYAVVNPDKHSSYETLVRPACGFLVVVLGNIINTHPCPRWLFLWCITFMILFDTTSEVLLYEDTQCIKMGNTCSGRSKDLNDLLYYQYRDLFAITVEVWALLLGAYLSIAIGVCVTRYSHDLLATSRQYHHIRDILEESHGSLHPKHPSNGAKNHAITSKSSHIR